MNIRVKLFLIPTFVMCYLKGYNQDDSVNFFDKILNDFSRNSYFIIVKTDVSGKIVESIVDNDDLFSYFKSVKKVDEKKYREFMLTVLQKNGLLKLSKREYKTFGFVQVKSSLSIDKDAKKGKEYFLNRYFKNKVLTNRLYLKERDAIIKKLFDWKMSSRIDDETGFLIIE